VIIAGMTYSLGAPNGASFGAQPGSVVIKYEGTALPSAVVQWQAQFTQFTAPRVNLVDTVPATLSIVLANGTVQHEIPILFAPPQPATSAAALGSQPQQPVTAGTGQTGALAQSLGTATSSY
jgi:hypothetical protein